MINRIAPMAFTFLNYVGEALGRCNNAKRQPQCVNRAENEQCICGATPGC
jgi:hypothetical protein